MERVQEFADETGVFGLNLMRQRVPKIEKIFWICLTIIFTALTIRDLQAAIQAFTEEETLTSVRLNDGEPITFDPSPIIQLTMREAFIHSKNVSNDSLLTILETTFSQTKHPQTLPDLLFQTNIRLFDYISTNIERYALLSQWLPKPDSISNDLLTVYNFYRKNNISLAYLRNVTAAMLCEKIEFKVSLQQDENAMNICHPGFVVEMHGFILRLKLSSTPVTFCNPRWYVQIRIGSDYVQLVDGILVDLEGSISHYNQKEKAETIAVNLGENQNIHESIAIAIQPILKFQKAERANSKCTTELGIDCETRCAVQQFFECTRCWPFGAPSHIQPANNTEICPGDQIFTLSETLDRCFANETRKKSYWAKCEDICKGTPQCEMKMFTHTENRESFNFFSIWYNIQSFKFPIFEEKLAQTFEKFMAQFGGSLGLYLGLSFASLVHIPVFIIRILASVVGSKSAKLSKTSSHIETSVHFKGKSYKEIETRYGALQGEISSLSSRFGVLEESVAAILNKQT